MRDKIINADPDLSDVKPEDVEPVLGDKTTPEERLVVDNKIDIAHCLGYLRILLNIQQMLRLQAYRM